MPKTALDKRHNTESILAVHAQRLADVGVSEKVAQESVEILVDAMRNAITPRGQIDYTARQRSAMYLLDLYMARRSGNTDGAASESPLVVLNLGGGTGGVVPVIDAPLT